MKRLLRSIFELIASLFSDLCDEVSDGIAEEDVAKVALNVTLITLLAMLIAFVGLAVINIAKKKPLWVLVGLILAAGLQSTAKKTDGDEQIGKPSEGDYRAIIETLRPAVAKVAEPLGLAPIYSHTDLTADPEEWILPWGKVWRLKYKALKKNAMVPIDTSLCKRIIQAQVKTVLEHENPSGFSDVRYQRAGSFVPILQVDEVTDGDAFIYIFIAISSKEYFRQKLEWETRKNMLKHDTDVEDDDF